MRDDTRRNWRAEARKRAAVTKAEREHRISAALDRLAACIEDGQLLLATNQPAFFEALAEKVETLELDRDFARSGLANTLLRHTGTPLAHTYRNFGWPDPDEKAEASS